MELYLKGEPADDERFVGVFAHELEHSGGYTPDDAIIVGPKRCCQTFFPMILAAPHPFRRMAGHSPKMLFDVFCGIYTNGKVTGDKVGSHSDLLRRVPYWDRRTISRPPFGSA